VGGWSPSIRGMSINRRTQQARARAAKGPQLHSAVGTGAVHHRDAVPGQVGAAVQVGLVALDGEQMEGLLDGHEELGGLAVGSSSSAGAVRYP
jgi:hypothetical protein